MQTRFGIVLGCLVLATAVGCEKKSEVQTAASESGISEAAKEVQTAASESGISEAENSDGDAQKSSVCLKDDYDPHEAYSQNYCDSSGKIVDRNGLDDHLKASQESNRWFQIAVTREDGRVRCDPEWRDRFSPYSRNDGPCDIPIPEICEYHCKVGLAGTEFVDGDRPVCHTPSGALDMPNAPRGYRCLDNDHVLARSMSFLNLENLYVSGKAPWERNVDPDDEYEQEQQNIWHVLDDSVPGYVCTAGWPDENPECLCGGKTIPFGTVCNDDHIVEKCTDDAGCACGGKTIGAGMYCDSGKAYCGLTEITDGITGTVCRHGILICNEKSCSWNGSTVSKGTALLGEKPRFHACLDKKGCTVNGESFAYGSVVFGDKTHQKANVENGMPYCGNAPMYENAEGFVCENHSLRCEADSCPYGKHVVTKGVVVDGREDFVCKREGGCTVDGKPLCGRNTPPELVYCRDGKGHWKPSPNHEIQCARIPNRGTTKTFDYDWVCADPAKKKFAMEDQLPRKQENGVYLVLYDLEHALCGSQEIRDYYTVKSFGGTCQDGVLSVQCGDMPAITVDDAMHSPLMCWNGVAIQCDADRCKLGDHVMVRDEVCNAKRCVTIPPIPQKAFNDACNRESEECNDCGMGQCSYGPYLEQDKWIATLLETDGEVCVNGNCPCGEGVCGRMGVCKAGNCYCGDLDNPNPPQNGSDMCVVFEREDYSHYGFRDSSFTQKGKWYGNK